MSDSQPTRKEKLLAEFPNYDKMTPEQKRRAKMSLRDQQRAEEMADEYSIGSGAARPTS